MTAAPAESPTPFDVRARRALPAGAALALVRAVEAEIAEAVAEAAGLVLARRLVLCKFDGRLIRVGGGPGTKRVDAEFCSDACRVAWHRAQERWEKAKKQAKGRTS